MTPNPPEFMEVDQSIGFREDGLSYYTTIIEKLSLVIAEKNMNVRRLQAQKNELIAKLKLVKKELQLLQEQGCVVGEVVKLMDKNTCKVLVKDIQKVP